MATRRRLDAELVRRGIVPSRERAREAIEDGRVLVSGSTASKPSRQVAADEPIVLQGPGPRFVSRGGEKLDAALERFGIEVAGRDAVDAGASTGGFTDCLLQRDARRVVAIDVGYGQLHERLVADDRVVLHDRTNIRHVDPRDLGGTGDVVVADLSFISLRTVAPALLSFASPGADLVVLVKPQFEAGRSEASKGRGIISDPVVWRRVVDEVIAAFVALGATMMDLMVSPITGSDGNVEFLLHLRAPGHAADEAGDAGRSGANEVAVAAALHEAQSLGTTRTAGRPPEAGQDL